MMRNVITALIFLMITAVSSAQSPEVLKAKSILDKVASKTKSYSSIKADFLFTLENKQADVTDTHQGSIILKGDKYKVNIMGTDSYFDGKTMWLHMIDANEVNITDPSMMEDEMLNPVSLFSNYEKGFNYIYDGETTIDGKVMDIIDLFPSQRDKSYSRIKLYFNRDNRQITRVKQVGKDGNNYIIDVKSMVVNTPVEDSVFHFDPVKHPGVEVIDLR
ncbi:LolA family protein [Geofilum sp. OHC36d9]|uniref:LolA family protein n=1 Tax=Geofilum sp. OHC36d9 TaxID=3458413 RepID=UPI00403326D2